MAAKPYTRIVYQPGEAAAVKLNRPDVRNALDDAALAELAHCFKAIAKDRSVRVVVLSGEGRDFCAGADINWMRRAGQLKGAAALKDAGLLAQAGRAIDECPVPVVARVHGAVFGGGLGLTAACDIVVAEENARFCFSECRLGILPAVISCFVVPKIGLSAARRYYLTAEVFGAKRAQELGLAHDVCPLVELDARVDVLAKLVIRNGPKANASAKAFLRAFPGKAPGSRADFAVRTLVRARSSPEGREGLSAFLEDRPAAWIKPPAP